MKRSWVWSYATRQGDTAFCSLCKERTNNEFSCRGGSTGAIGKHLKLIHSKTPIVTSNAFGDVMVNVNCAVSGCSTNARVNKELSWHRIPSDRRLDAWLKFCQRPDIRDKSKEQLKNHYVCSLHFEPWMFKNGGKKQSLYGSAVPTLRGLGDGVTGGVTMKADNEEVTAESYSMEGTNDAVVKQEIEDMFSEHEEDIEQQLENRKRQMEINVSAIDVKRIKVEEPNEASQVTSVEMPVVTPTIMPVAPAVTPVKFVAPKVMVEVDKDNDVFPVDFMKTVLNSQQEILKVLKSQVLLENPDRHLLTFLRLLGVKLSRLNPEKRREMQDAILKLID